ncbi:NUDIX domain-containing protein [Hymenobacter algoricola]|uniref:NUDIX domain-containing protein n=1 Tax=Hymenobacter algoricola TaxID=486267 RepID=A0ABP7N8U5_9BACT
MSAPGVSGPIVPAPLMTSIDKIAWLHLSAGRLLSTRSFGKDRYYIPGGKREAGETDVQTLLREIKEELTVDLDPASLRYAGTFEAQAHGHPTGLLVRMTCYYAHYQGTLQPAAEIEQLVWLTYRHRPEVSPVDQLIFDWLRAQALLAD